MKHAIFDAGDTAQWVLGIGLAVWIVQYTVYAPWWTDPIGRSIVWLALSFELVLGPSLATLADPQGMGRFIGSTGYDYLETANLVFAASVIVGRIYQFWHEHRTGSLTVSRQTHQDRRSAREQDERLAP